jgi:uncharacterized protein (DUF169 family)
LASYPLGVRLFERKEEVPPFFKKPEAKTNLCQLMALARQNGLLVVGSAEDMICIAGAAFLGMAKIPDRLASGELSLQFHLNKCAAKKKMESVPALRKANKAVGFFPLGKISMDPDVILIYGNSAQMMRLIQAYAYHEGASLEITTNGEFACAYSIAYPIIEKTAHMTIPCYGERKYAQVGDDQLIFSIPFGLLDRFMEALTETHKNGMRLPIVHQLDYIPTMSEQWRVSGKDL